MLTSLQTKISSEVAAILSRSISLLIKQVFNHNMSFL